jgi:hypothetical protein
LVSTQVLNDIAAGTKDINDYPGIQKLNNDAVALNEKVQAIKDFQEINSTIVNDLASGAITFNLNILSTKKQSLNVSKNLFWNSPLGDSTISNSGGQISFTQTYTSSGTYKFKNNELVNLSTTYVSIINALVANTKPGTLAVTFTAGEQPKIIQIIDGYVYAYGEESPIIPSVNQKAIINVSEVYTKEIDISTNIGRNEKAQPHTAIPVVKENYTFTTDPNVNLKVFHPTINGLFYANTVEVNLSSNTLFTTPTFEYAFNIRQLQNLETPVSSISESFGFNAKEIPLTNWFINNDNIISQVKEEIKEVSFNFNAFVIPLDNFTNNDNIITQVKEDLDTWSGGILIFNPSLEPLPSVSSKNDNIIEQDVEASTFGFITFNAQKVNSYDKIKNGYAVLDWDRVESVLESAPGFTVIEYNLNNSNATNTSNLEKFEKWYDTFGKPKKEYSILELGQKTRLIIASQTGLGIKEFEYPDDTLNKLAESVPRMLTALNVRIHEPESVMEKLNSLKEPYDAVLQVTTLNNSKEFNLNKPEVSGIFETSSYINNNCLNSLEGDIAIISTLNSNQLYHENTWSKTNSSEYLNVDNASIPVPTIQLNPGVTLE